MAIASSIIGTWTKPGAQDAAQRTYTSIKTALSRSDRLSAYTYDVFLQGSYANATNLRGDSDVDVVVMLTSTYMPATQRLSTVEKARHEARRTPGTTTVATFRQVVNQALVDYYGLPRVQPKNKCIRVTRGSDTVDADVVPAYQYRLFTSYPDVGEPKYIEGIEIHPLSGSSIVNYPKEHIKNGQQKNKQCSDRYKPAVRQVKQLANHAADLGKFRKGEVPGYVLECMTYNMPDERFVGDDTDRLIKVMTALDSLSPEDYRNYFWSCDGIHHLFQDDPGQHNEHTAKRVIHQMWETLAA